MTGSCGDVHRYAVAEIPMRLLCESGDNVVVTAQFQYTTRDPYAVRARFIRDQHTPVTWVFARDLLLVGAARHTGMGDVQVYPSGDDVVIELSSPEGSAILAAPTTEIHRFDAQMLALVAPGDEGNFVDVDAELIALERAAVTGHEA